MWWLLNVSITNYTIYCLVLIQFAQQFLPPPPKYMFILPFNEKFGFILYAPSHLQTVSAISEFFMAFPMIMSDKKKSFWPFKNLITMINCNELSRPLYSYHFIIIIIIVRYSPNSTATLYNISLIWHKKKLTAITCTIFMFVVSTTAMTTTINNKLGLSCAKLKIS